MLQGFWAWLECANLFVLAAFVKEKVRKAIWAALPMGAWVYSRDIVGKCQIVEKDISKKTGKWRLWLRSKGVTEAIDPLDISTLVQVI